MGLTQRQETKHAIHTTSMPLIVHTCPCPHLQVVQGHKKVGDPFPQLGAVLGQGLQHTQGTNMMKRAPGMGMRMVRHQGYHEEWLPNQVGLHTSHTSHTLAAGRMPRLAVRQKSTLEERAVYRGGGTFVKEHGSHIVQMMQAWNECILANETFLFLSPPLPPFLPL